jgi:hypothetical protein
MADDFDARMANVHRALESMKDVGGHEPGLPGSTQQINDESRGRTAEFAAGHNSARPDTGLSGNYSPPKEQWDAESLRTVEMERMHQLTSDKDY